MIVMRKISKVFRDNCTRMRNMEEQNQMEIDRLLSTKEVEHKLNQRPIIPSLVHKNMNGLTFFFFFPTLVRVHIIICF